MPKSFPKRPRDTNRLAYTVVQESISHVEQRQKDLKRRAIVPKKASPYSSKESSVYHIYGDCSDGNNIEEENRIYGTRDAENRKKDLCEECGQIASKQHL